jgi:glycosyltransferase involved in cell wall biosynthesis
MTFSIIIPAYNEEKYIGKSLAAIKSLKVPQGESLEVIVVNNASTDQTEAVSKNALPWVRIINESKKGLTRAYNRGAREATGEILLFVDADTILSPDHLVKVLKEFRKNPGLVAMSGPCLWKDGGLLCDLVTRFMFLFIAMPAEIIFNRWLNIGASIASGNSAVKKEFFDKAGGFNENIFYGLEADFTIRIKKFGRVRFKYHLGNETSARRLKKEGVLRMLCRYVANIVWLHFFHKPFTKNYIDVR